MTMATERADPLRRWNTGWGGRSTTRRPVVADLNIAHGDPWRQESPVQDRVLLFCVAADDGGRVNVGALLTTERCKRPQTLVCRSSLESQVGNRFAT